MSLYDEMYAKEYAERDRFDEKIARELLMRPSPKITHLTINDDGTYSIVTHINCEWCDFCEDSVQGDCRGVYDAKPVPSKMNIYENVRR